ncbi:MAG: hypothetical protein QM755_06945 [Luteolibacter sp.]
MITSSCTRRISAENDPAWRKLEVKRVALVQQIKLAQEKLSQSERRRTTGVDVIAKAADLKTRRAELEHRRDELQTLIPQMEAALVEAHLAHLADARQRAAGLEFTSLTTRSGNRFDHVKIVEVDDMGVKISHSAGIARLGVEDLDASQRNRFGLDENLQQLANQRLNADQNAYYQQLDRDLQVAQASVFTEPSKSRTAQRDVYLPQQMRTPNSRPFGFERPVGLGESSSSSPRRTYQIWRYGTGHSYRYY